MRTHLVCLTLAVLAFVCFILSAFGIHAFGSLELVPLGLAFFVGSHAAHHVPVA